MEVSKWPTYRELEEAIIKAFNLEGQQLTNEQISRSVADILKIQPGLLAQMHSPSRSELDYRLAWARTRMAKKNLIRRVGPKLWENASKSF